MADEIDYGPFNAAPTIDSPVGGSGDYGPFNAAPLIADDPQLIDRSAGTVQGFPLSEASTSKPDVTIPQTREELTAFAATPPPTRQEQRRQALEAERRRIEDERNQDDFTKIFTGIGLGLGSGREEIKRKIGGSLQGTLGKALIAGPILGPLFNKQLTGAGEIISDEAVAEQRVLEGESLEMGGNLARLGKKLAEPALPSFAALAAAPAGLAGIAVLSGLQSYGATYDDAKRAGYDKPEIPALINGIVTGGLTRVMGGTEKFIADLASGKLKQQAAVELVHGIFKSAAFEFPEELLDQFSQGIVAKYSYEPNKTWQSIVDEAIKAGAVGSLYGGVGAATVAGAVTGARKAGEAIDYSLQERELKKALGDRANEVAKLYNDPRFQNDPRFDEILGPEKRNIPGANPTGESVSSDNMFRIARFVTERLGDTPETLPTKRYLASALGNPTGASADALAQLFGYTIDNAVTDMPTKFLNQESRMPPFKIGVPNATNDVGQQQRGSVSQRPGTDAQVQEVPPDRPVQTQVNAQGTSASSGDSLPQSGAVAVPPVTPVPRSQETVTIDAPDNLMAEPAVGPVEFKSKPTDAIQTQFTLSPTGGVADLESLPFSPAQKELLMALAPFVSDVPWVAATFPERIRAGGMFDGKNVILSANLTSKPKQALRVLLHEYVHAATYSALRQESNSAIKDRLDQLMGYAYTKWAFAKKSDMEKRVRDRRDYAFSNLDEFVAAALTDKHFQEWLAGIKVTGRSKVGQPSGRIANVFKEFIRILSDLFGIKNPNILEEVLKETDELIRQPAPERSLISPILRPRALQETTKGALATEKVVRTATERERESLSMMGQAVDMQEAYDRAGAAGLTTGAANLLGYTDVIGIASVGQRMAGGVANNYRQIKAAATPHDLTWYARVAAAAWKQLDKKVSDIEKRLEEIKKRNLKPSFQNLLTKEALAKLKKDNAAMMLRVQQSVFSSALDLTRKILRDESRSDQEVAELEGQLRGMEAASQSPAGMSQLLQDMVATLSSTPQGLALLRSPGANPLFVTATPSVRQQMVKVYRDIKTSTGQPLHNSTLINWASFILKKNQDLQDFLLAAHLSSTSQVRSLLNPFQAQFQASFDKNPAVAVRSLLRSTKSLTTDREKTAFVWHRLNHDVTKRLNEYAMYSEAAALGRAVLNDPAAKTLRVEINTDSEHVGNQKPIIPHIDSTLILPDGTQVSIKTRLMIGAKTEFAQNRAVWEKAAKTLETWLADTANQFHPDFKVHRTNLEKLQAYYIGQSILQPNDPIRWAKRSFDRIWDAVQQIGGRVAAQLKIDVRDYERTRQRAEVWNQRTTYELSNKLIAAMTSHGMDWSSLTDQTFIDAADQWHRQVGNQLKASWNAMFGGSGKGGLEVGDMLGSGLKVTAADMAYLKAEDAATSAGFDIAGDSQLTEETLGNVVSFRRALKGSPLMTTRTFDDRYLRSFAQPARQAYLAYVAAEAVKDPAAQASAAASFAAAFNANWSPEFAHAWVWDRNPQFVREATDMDGQNGAFRKAAAEIEADPSAIPDYDSLVNYLSANSALTPEEVQVALIKDWGHLVDNWVKEVEVDPLKSTQRAVETGNSFTRSRNDQIAPYIFYRNGLRHSHDVGTFAVGIFSTRMDKMVAGFNQAAEDIRRQMAEFQQAKDKAQLAGVKDFESQTIEANAEERRNGDTYDYYQNLDRRLKFAESMVANLSGDVLDSDLDTTLTRIVGDVTGMMILSTGATALNIATGPIFLGQFAMRLNGSFGRTFIQALIQAFIFRQAIQLSSTLYSTGKAVFFDMVKGGLKATYNLKDPQFRSVRQWFQTAGHDALVEIAEHAYERTLRFKRYKDAGIISLPRIVAEYDARLLGSMASAGRVGDLESKQTSKVKRGSLGLLGVMETFTTAILKAYNPLWGDVAINMATADMVLGSMGLIAQMEGRLKDLFLDFRSGGISPDGHRFSPREIFPSIWSGQQLSVPRIKSGNDLDMFRLRETFNKSGMNFDEKAAAFINELATNPKAQFLTDDERYNMADSAINDVNRASPANQPLSLRSRTFFNTIGSPFLFWATRKTADFVNSFEVPALIETGLGKNQSIRTARAAQWAMLVGWVIFPLIMFTGVLGKPLAEEESRLIKRLLYNQVVSTRQFWERQTLQQQVGGLVQNMAGAAPFIETIAMLMFNDMPQRASLDRNLAVVEKLKDAIRYVGGVMQTGDFTYKLGDFVGSLIPDTKIVINRLGSEEGRRGGNNVVALLRRYGPTDMLRPMGGGGGASATPLSPYLTALENYAVSGDDVAFGSKYREAVERAREMGKAEPEEYVRDLFASRSAYNRALSKKFSPEEHQAFLEKLAPADRQAVENYERNFARAGQLLGANVTYEQGPKGGGGFTGGLRAAASSAAGVPRGTRRSSLSRRKSFTRLRRRRSSISRLRRVRSRLRFR